MIVERGTQEEVNVGPKLLSGTKLVVICLKGKTNVTYRLAGEQYFYTTIHACRGHSENC